MAETTSKKPNLTGLQPRAFITDTDTHFGAVLCRTLVTKGDYEVWGTVRNTPQPSPPTSGDADTTTAEAVVPNKIVRNVLHRGDPLYRRQLKQALMDSDVIVYQLVDSVEDATMALKMMMNAQFETEKTFILISSVQTWAETRSNKELAATNEADEDEAEKKGEDGAGGEEGEDGADMEAYSEDMYNKRVPHVKYTAWKEVEKLCKQANSATLHTYVIFSGLMYGEGEDKLHAIFKQAWHLAPEGLPVFGTGRNLVPMIHVQDLATACYRLASREEPLTQRYLFGTDDGNLSWNSIIKAINASIGNGKTYKVQESELILYEHVEHFIVNLKVEAAGIKSVMEDETDFSCQTGFVENITKIVSEFQRVRKVTPLRVAILGPPAAGKSYYGEKLAKHYKLPHLKIGDVVADFIKQETTLKEELQKIKRKKKEEKRQQAMEEKRRAREEAEEERRRARAEAGEDGAEDPAEAEAAAAAAEQAEQEGKEGEEGEEAEEGEGAEGEGGEGGEGAEKVDELEADEEDDEHTEALKVRLRELRQILKMKIKTQEQKRMEEEAEAEKAKAKKKQPALKGKLQKDGTAPTTPRADEAAARPPPTRYTDKCIAMMYRWKLSQPECRNQGYILDGYPKTVAQASLLFEEGELEVPEDGAGEEEEDAPAASEDKELKKAEDKRLPDYVISLASRDEFLTERLMRHTTAIANAANVGGGGAAAGVLNVPVPPPASGSGGAALPPPTLLAQALSHPDHNNPADFQRRLDFYKANSNPSAGVVTYLESVLTNSPDVREVIVREIRVDTASLTEKPTSPKASSSSSSTATPSIEELLDPSLRDPPPDPVFDQMVAFIGPAHNYGPTPQEIEAAYRRELRKDQERARLAAEAEKARLEREQKDRQEVERLRAEEARRLAAIQAQEKAMLEVRKEPLKKYLMANVIPVLTQGLIEVCEVRPEDPIDYLAEWLFKHNPDLVAKK